MSRFADAAALWLERVNELAAEVVGRPGRSRRTDVS
jgi:hypothetical protein